MLNYDINRMKSKVTFGKSKRNEDNTISGGHDVFVPVTTVWCGTYTNTQTQTFDNLGAHVDYDIVIAIRHNPDINKRLFANYKDKVYKIVAINSDERLGAFDLITLKQFAGLPLQK